MVTIEAVQEVEIDLGGALCLVEVTIRPTVHVGSDPGDEDDRRAFND